MSESIREPAVAGLFYPSNKDKLTELITKLDTQKPSETVTPFLKHHLIGGIVPHAGYIYSGYHAVQFFKLLKNTKQEIDTIVILNPNHRGAGPNIALDANSVWTTPLKNTNIDQAFYKALDINVASIAHDDEHSGEVMLPMIQYYLPGHIKIAPISMFDQSYETASLLANKINSAVKKTRKKIIIIASSDFSHFVSPNEGYKFDNMVCDKIEKLDAKGVYETVRKMNISVCGYGPIMALIEYCTLNHPKAKTKILSRGHSGEISPSTRVVDYITTLFYE